MATMTARALRRTSRASMTADAAGRFFTALVKADRVLKKHRASLTGNTGPVQLWPHGFDLAMEWYGTRVERTEEGGQTKELPAQLNLGFYPGEDDDSSYFYSNPWPFDGDKLLGRALPEGASWHTEGWQGAMLPYAALRDDPRPRSVCWPSPPPSTTSPRPSCACSTGFLSCACPVSYRIRILCPKEAKRTGE
jgi:hypothetical protein